MGATTTIRVSRRTRDRLAGLAKASGKPMTEVVDDAVEALDRRQFFAAFNRRYAELRSDPEAWGEIEAERAIESTALRDAPS